MMAPLLYKESTVVTLSLDSSYKVHCRNSDATHRPVGFFHMHVGIADYFHHGG